ncbi:hypothetical protein [Halorubrum sp. SD626R]|uniref:hypothetical protein n=1 Tax=Halorubrum sp. SD626R TaxID=1419722 RepID=UPI0013054512|nr:hypothetical protein [Halorubrum sp. SD626R]
MSRSKEPTHAPSGSSKPSDENPPDRRAGTHFDARDVLAGRLDGATVAQAVEGQR